MKTANIPTRIVAIAIGAVATLGAAACASEVADEGVLAERVQLPQGEVVNGVPLEDDLPLFAIDADDVEIREAQSDTDGSVEVEGEPATQVAEPCRAFVLDGPTFPSNGAALTEDGLSVITQLISELNTNACGRDRAANECEASDLGVVLEGHTDDVPTNRTGGNLQLSLDRAQSVADVFTAAGIAVVSVDGFADTRPAAEPPGDGRIDDERRQANRRTEIRLFCQA